MDKEKSMAELYKKKALIVGATGGMGSAVATMLTEKLQLGEFDV